MRNIITQSTPEQLRFPASNGLTIRADFNGEVLSTDLGPLILGGVDRQIQLTHQMAEAFNDQRHPYYIGHRLTREELPDGPQVAERLSFRSNTTFTYMPWSRRLVFSDTKFDLHEDFFMGLDIDALHTQRYTNFSSHRNCAFLALH